MGFPESVKVQVLVACKRCCCLCETFRGTKIEIHHIKQVAEGGDNTFDNAIPLCFDCHADMTSYDFKHPKGNKYTEKELKQRRNNWYEKVKNINLPDINYPKSENTKGDEINYNRIIKIIHECIIFIKRTNFASLFDRNKLNSLLEIIDATNDPLFVFRNKDLELLKDNLLQNIVSFNYLINYYTYPTNNSSFSSVYTGQEYNNEHYDYVEKIIYKIKDSAKNLCEAYELFLQRGIEVLGIYPDIAT
jgi:hypothetical protein